MHRAWGRWGARVASCAGAHGRDGWEDLGGLHAVRQRGAATGRHDVGCGGRGRRNSASGGAKLKPLALRRDRVRWGDRGRHGPRGLSHVPKSKVTTREHGHGARASRLGRLALARPGGRRLQVRAGLSPD
eukprot:3014673-Prymnesium_polylepis.1